MTIQDAKEVSNSNIKKLNALLNHLEVTELPFISINEYICTIEREKGVEEVYHVFTDSEANTMLSNIIGSMADDAEYEIPEHLRRYFDRELYIEDSFEEERAVYLSPFNHLEETCTVEGKEFFIYRVS